MDPVLISYTITIAVSLGVGVPVLLRGWRQRDLPIALLGATATIDGLEWLAWAVCSYSPAYGTPLGTGLAITSRLGLSASLICLVAFTRIVFRPAAGSARAFIWITVGALGVGFLGSGAVGDWTGERNDHFWVWLENIGQTVAYGWAALEPFRYYRQMSRRVRLGLAEPALANRFLLWSLYAGFYCLGQMVYCVSLAFFGMLSLLDVLNSSLTVAAVLCMLLAVYPPAAYARRFRSAPPSSS